MMDEEDAAPAAAQSIIRVLVADDHAIVREGLILLVSAQPDMIVVGEAADGEAACRLARDLRPHVLVMDLSMPVVDGVTATSRLQNECPLVRVLALTVHEEGSYITQLLAAGAKGYVLKRSAASELVRGIRAVAAGEAYIDPLIGGTVVNAYLARTLDRSLRHATLSEREAAVLRRIATGYSNKEIAAELKLSVKTVETYKARAAEKLGLATRVDIVRYAAQQGWIKGSMNQ